MQERVLFAIFYFGRKKMPMIINFTLGDEMVPVENHYREQEVLIQESIEENNLTSFMTSEVVDALARLG